MAKGGRPENLVPIQARATEEQREIRRKGAMASHKKQAEKKLLSQIYAEFLCDTFDIEFSEDEKKKMSGIAFVKEVQKRVLSRCDSASVSMLKEIREATEGSKTILTGEEGTPVKFEIVDPPKRNENTTKD